MTNQPLREAIQSIVDEIEVVITIKAGTQSNKSIGTKTATNEIIQLFLTALDDLEKMAVPEKLVHYQQETERTKREKAYYNKALDQVHAGFEKYREGLK